MIIKLKGNIPRSPFVLSTEYMKSHLRKVQL